MATSLVMAVQARATLFDITFTSNDGLISGSGILNGQSEGGGLYEAIGGSSFNIAVSPEALAYGFIPGEYSIYVNPNSPSASYSPSGYFIYDNQVLNGQNPFITNPGLLFTGPNGALTTLELNLFSNGPSSPIPNGTYQLYENDGANVYGDANLSLVPVPEASTMLAGALMLLPLGMSAVRIFRKSLVA